MTSRLTPRITYTIGQGDTAKKRFDFAFKIYKDSDLKVVLSDGTTPSAYGVYISNNTDGGYIQLTSPLAVGTKITLYRQMAFVRHTQFRENRDFRASVMNEEFDRMIMLLQQVGRHVQDAVRIPLADIQVDMTLPMAHLRANKVLAFDNQGRVQVRQDISDSVTLAEKHATDAKNSEVITARNKRQVEHHLSTLDLTPYAKKTDLGTASAKDTAFFIPITDMGNGVNQIPKTDTDFKTKFTRAVGNVGGKLPTTLFTQTSGKFFVRYADGSLPYNIDTHKVWSLADQKTARGGTAPNGKNHIELPVGKVLFKVAGAGGGGAYGVDGYHGSKGGNTTLANVTAYGGDGGRGFQNLSGGKWWDYGRYNAWCNLNGENGYVLRGQGAAGGDGGWRSKARQAQAGMNGGLGVFVKNITHGVVVNCVIGASGAGSKSGHMGYPSAGIGGEKGYVIAEYVA